jgi:hypothetical protein
MIKLAIPRICPGRHFALRTVYIIVACVLSVFDIEPALDEDGKPQLPIPEFDTSIVRYVFATGAHVVTMMTDPCDITSGFLNLSNVRSNPVLMTP